MKRLRAMLTAWLDVHVPLVWDDPPSNLDRMDGLTQCQNDGRKVTA